MAGEYYNNNSSNNQSDNKYSMKETNEYKPSYILEDGYNGYYGQRNGRKRNSKQRSSFTIILLTAMA